MFKPNLHKDAANDHVSVCMARGRSYTVPLTPLIESCDEWHSSDIADIWDGSIISSAVLRRDLVRLRRKPFVCLLQLTGI